MKDLNNTWGLYPWFDAHDTDLVHPDDLEKFRYLFPYGKVFRCIGEEEGYLVIKYGIESYRVKPNLYKQVPVPKFDTGDKVCEKERSHIKGIICEILWHHNNREFIYFIEINGKKKTRRYRQEELVKFN